MESTMGRPDWRVWRDANVAAAFTDVRRGGVYGASAQFETMLRLIAQVPADATAAPFVLDLGCGDGVLLAAVLDAHSAARGVALDGSAAMLDKARERIAHVDPRRVRFIEADFGNPDWCDAVEPAAFHAVVSGFAIHHLEDDQKQTVYARAFDLLKPGGVFVNIEHVASAGPVGERLFEETFARHLTNFLRTRGGRPDATFEQVLAEGRAAPDRAANCLSPVETQLGWLRDIGFVEVDCYWKWYELAVLAGFRPAENSRSSDTA